MKRVIVFILAAALAVFVDSWTGQVQQLASAGLAYAASGGHGGGGGDRGGGRGGRGGGGQFRGHGGGSGGGGQFRGHGGGEFRGHGGGEFRGHGGHGHGGHFSGGIWIGPGWWWDPFLYPYYPYYPYYTQPPVVIQQPQEYVMPEPQPAETNYWYYCKEAKGYYPYVKGCPGGWMKVAPAPAPPGEED